MTNPADSSDSAFASLPDWMELDDLLPLVNPSQTVLAPSSPPPGLLADDPSDEAAPAIDTEMPLPPLHISLSSHAPATPAASTVSVPVAASPVKPEPLASPAEPKPVVPAIKEEPTPVAASRRPSSSQAPSPLLPTTPSLVAALPGAPPKALPASPVRGSTPSPAPTPTATANASPVSSHVVAAPLSLAAAPPVALPTVAPMASVASVAPAPPAAPPTGAALPSTPAAPAPIPMAVTTSPAERLPVPPSPSRRPRTGAITKPPSGAAAVAVAGTAAAAAAAAAAATAAGPGGGARGSEALAARRRAEAARFPRGALSSLEGTTSAEVRRMSGEERELVLYKRKLRNRESARRSRQKRQATLAELQDEVDDLAMVSARVLDLAAALKGENERLGEVIKELRDEKEKRTLAAEKDMCVVAKKDSAMLGG